ncbi:MAG TPA: hypothetical protein VK184_12365 [Nostocaceae cyanobacterium]|nr:hypothetical protein [Nostocaceae cyanobacterium]
MTSEQEEGLQACVDEIAKILYEMTPKSELNDLSDVEMVVRKQIWFYRSPYGISSSKSSKNFAPSRLQVLIP